MVLFEVLQAFCLPCYHTRHYPIADGEISIDPLFSVADQIREAVDTDGPFADGDYVWIEISPTWLSESELDENPDYTLAAVARVYVDEKSAGHRF